MLLPVRVARAFRRTRSGPGAGTDGAKAAEAANEGQSPAAPVAEVPQTA